MKDTILTEMPINELNDLLFSEKERLAKLKMSHAVSPLENPLSIKYSILLVMNLIQHSSVKLMAIIGQIVQVQNLTIIYQRVIILSMLEPRMKVKILELQSL